jgi:hypothetical protein
MPSFETAKKTLSGSVADADVLVTSGYKHIK